MRAASAVGVRVDRRPGGKYRISCGVVAASRLWRSQPIIAISHGVRNHPLLRGARRGVQSSDVWSQCREQAARLVYIRQTLIGSLTLTATPALQQHDAVDGFDLAVISARSPPEWKHHAYLAAGLA